MCVMSQGHSQNTIIVMHRKTAKTSPDSHQLHPFSKCGLLFKERICSQRERTLSFKSSRFWYEKRLFLYYVICLECVEVLVPMCINAYLELHPWCLLFFADNLFKQFIPRLGLTKCLSLSRSKLFLHTNDIPEIIFGEKKLESKKKNKKESFTLIEMSLWFMRKVVTTLTLNIYSW